MRDKQLIFLLLLLHLFKNVCTFAEWSCRGYFSQLINIDIIGQQHKICLHLIRHATDSLSLTRLFSLSSISETALCHVIFKFDKKAEETENEYKRVYIC